jgi:GNAT superfamily N-acetyltransferase
VNVRKLDTLPVTLLWESEREGLRFVRRLQEDAERGAVRLTGTGRAAFGVFERRALLGACALSRDPYAPAVRDGARLGRVRQLYVLRAYRPRGVGRGLLEALLEGVLASYDAPTLRTETASAAAFYGVFGFRRVAWPNATHLFPLSHAA